MRKLDRDERLDLAVADVRRQIREGVPADQVDISALDAVIKEPVT